MWVGCCGRGVMLVGGFPAGTDIAASGRRPAARDGASRCPTSEESGKTTRVAPDEDLRDDQSGSEHRPGDPLTVRRVLASAFGYGGKRFGITDRRRRRFDEGKAVCTEVGVGGKGSIDQVMAARLAGRRPFWMVIGVGVLLISSCTSGGSGVNKPTPSGSGATGSKALTPMMPRGLHRCGSN